MSVCKASTKQLSHMQETSWQPTRRLFASSLSYCVSEAPARRASMPQRHDPNKDTGRRRQDEHKCLPTRRPFRNRASEAAEEPVAEQQKSRSHLL